MKVSAINATPIKPQSFGMAKEDRKEIETVLDKTDAVYGAVVQPNVKKPIAIVASVGLAVLSAYLFGSKLAYGATKVFKTIANPVIKEEIAGAVNEKGEQLYKEYANPKYFENIIKTGVGKVTEFASALKDKAGDKSKLCDKVADIISKVPEGNEQKMDKAVRKIAKLGKKSALGDKVVDTAYKLFDKGLVYAKKGYKKVVNIGVEKLDDPVKIGEKKLQNFVGALTAAVMLPKVCKADANKDGIADISQRGQNAYTGARTIIKDSIQRSNVVGDLLDLLT